MNALDYALVALYLLGMLYLGYRYRAHSDDRDYFLGGNQFGWFATGLSVMATQLSAVSFISVPAFVGARPDGGLQWVSTELHAPLTMLALMVFIIPPLYRSGVISVYGYLEQRFSRLTRLLIGGVFLFNRVFASAMIVYTISLVLDSALGIGFVPSVLLIGVITVVYSYQGGMRAVIYGDAVQMLLLLLGMIVCGAVALNYYGGVSEWIAQIPAERTVALDFDSLGLGDGEEFGFWPLLIGGFFISVAYYGTDQSEAQRFLSVRDLPTMRRTLLFVGMLRYPVLLAYALLGLLIGPIMLSAPKFAPALAERSDALVPLFLVNYVPHGLLGLIVVALVAATMSALSSAVNSLSAVTIEDYFRLGDAEDTRKVRYARFASLFWGVLCLTLALFVGNIDENIVVAMGKVGSVTFGPILGVFLLSILIKRVHATAANIGLAAGIAVNLTLALFFEEAFFWIWWNVIGTGVTFLVGLLLGRVLPGMVRPLPLTLRPDYAVLRSWEAWVLYAWFLLVLGVSWGWPLLLG